MNSFRRSVRLGLVQLLTQTFPVTIRKLRLHFKMIQGILEVGSHTSLKIFCLLTHSQRLAHFLDRPLFPWRRLIIGFSLGQFCLENWLLWRQYGVYQRTVRPKALEQEITQETYDKSQVCSHSEQRLRTTRLDLLGSHG